MFCLRIYIILYYVQSTHVYGKLKYRNFNFKYNIQLNE